MRNVIALDTRRRASLARFGKKEHTLYWVEVDEDGTIRLIPVRLEKETS